MKVEDISRVLVVGAGTMGRQIGFQCPAFNYPDLSKTKQNRTEHGTQNRRAL